MTFKKSITALLAAIFMVGGAVAITTSLAGTAHAQASDAKQVVDQAKADGVIGESITGYLSAVSEPLPQDIEDAMNEINIGRKTVFTQKARQQNVQTEVIAQLTGEKLVANAPSGQKVRGADGVWISK